MNMQLKTITPLHVGSGAEYTPAEFYFASMKKKKIMVRADISKVFIQLSDEDKDDLIVELENPQFSLHEYLLKLKNNNKKVDTSKIRQYFSLIKGKRSEIREREVHENLKTSHKAYIPGSSIKGAIKTALLYDMVNSNDIHQMIRLFSRGYDNKYRIKFKESGRFPDQFFSSDTRKAPNTSIMRFLQITDTDTIPLMSIYTTASIKANRMGWELYRRGRNIVKTSMETIDQGNQLNCRLNIVRQKQVLQKLKADKLEEYLDQDYIMNCLYRFSDDIIQNEISFAEKYRIDCLEQFYNKIESSNNPKKPLLNIGHGTGFLGTTIGLKIKDSAPEIYEMVRESTRGRTYPDEFPKTRKIVLGENVPLGWVQVGLE